MELVKYHVRITPEDGETAKEVMLDLDFNEVQRRFLEPRRQGTPITINGRTFELSKIEKIEIAKSMEDSATLIDRIRRKGDSSGIIDFSPDSWGIIEEAEDITNQLISGPPGQGITSDAKDGGELWPPADTRRVFVVHGRNERARVAMFTFLRSIGLEPLEWSRAVLETKKTAPYVGQVLDAAFKQAHAIVVLFTPDDEARLLEAFRTSGDPAHETELTGQARPNVLFEAGMAFGKSEDRTILVELGKLRPFSDVAGRHVIRLDNTSQRRQELAQRLQNAGCPVNLDDTDWHLAGDFDTALNTSEASSSTLPPRAQNRANPPNRIVLTEHYGAHNVLPPELAAQIPLDPRVPESSDSMWLSDDGRKLHNGDNVYVVCSTLEEARERSREVGVQTAWYDENFTYTSSRGETRRGSWIWKGSKPAKERSYSN